MARNPAMLQELTRNSGGVSSVVGCLSGTLEALKMMCELCLIVNCCLSLSSLNYFDVNSYSFDIIFIITTFNLSINFKFV